MKKECFVKADIDPLRMQKNLFMQHVLAQQTA